MRTVLVRKHRGQQRLHQQRQQRQGKQRQRQQQQVLRSHPTASAPPLSVSTARPASQRCPSLSAAHPASSAGSTTCKDGWCFETAACMRGTINRLAQHAAICQPSSGAPGKRQGREKTRQQLSQQRRTTLNSGRKLMAAFTILDSASSPGRRDGGQMFRQQSPTAKLGN